MESKHLRAVPSTGVPSAPKPEAPPVPPTITAAVQSGSQRDVWAAMREKLAKAIDSGEVSSNAIASTYKELRELDRLIRLADAEAVAAKGASNSDNTGRRSFNATAV